MLAIAITSTACTIVPQVSSPTLPTTTVTTAPGPTTTTIPADEGTELFRNCFVAAGLDIEPIPLDAQGRPRLDLVMVDIDFSDPDAVDALSACSEYLVAGPLYLSGTPILQANVIGLLTEFSDCIRSRGVSDFPDPISDYNGIGGPYPVDEIPFASPDLAGAVDDCGVRLANRTAP